MVAALWNDGPVEPRHGDPRRTARLGLCVAHHRPPGRGGFNRVAKLPRPAVAGAFDALATHWH